MPIACNLGLTPLAARDHSADGAWAWRQCGDGFATRCGRRWRSEARAGDLDPLQAGHALAGVIARAQARRQGAAALRRRASAFRAQLRTALLACGLRRRSGDDSRDRHRAAAADGRCARRRAHRRLLRRRTLEYGRRCQAASAISSPSRPRFGNPARKRCWASPQRWARGQAGSSDRRCCARSTARPMVRLAGKHEELAGLLARPGLSSIARPMAACRR